jgi:hypothetical protein
MQDNKAVYRQFIDFEEQAATIYFQLASRFSPEKPELASFWIEMGIQEKQHAGLLQFCVAEELFCTQLPSDQQTENVRELFGRLAQKARDQALGVEEAFAIAREMEESEVNEIFDCLTTPLHDSSYLLRRKIAISIPDHRALLERQAAVFRDQKKENSAA